MPATPKPARQPTRLRIGHAHFDIEHSDRECDAQDAGGLMIGPQRRIVLYETAHGDKAQEDLLHEIVHACIYVAGAEFSDAKEEKFVRAVTGPLLSTLRDNPELVAYLAADKS